MLLFSKIKILIAFAFSYLFQNVNLTNYISLKLTEVDDCVRLINISNQIVFNFSQQNIRENCDCTWISKGPCDANNWWNYYAPDDFLIKDYEYEFMTGIEITFEDWNRLNGYMSIDIYLNEYIIKLSDQKFWECKNCYDSNNVTGILLYEEDEVYKPNMEMYPKKVLRFHPPNPKPQDPEKECYCGPDYYKFVFKIDDINDLYKGGKNGSFQMNTDFYTFSNESQVKIEKEVNYSRNDIELELINFNFDDIVYSKSNPSLVFKNNDKDFIYKICVDDKEGQLEGFDLNNGGNLANGDCFLETSGLNYTLGIIEKETNYTEVKLKISVFKKCPEDTETYKFCDGNTPIINEKDFIFQIKIIRPPEDSTETPSDSTKETETPSDSTKETETPSDSTKETETPSDSTKETETPSDSTKETETPSDSTKETETPSDSTKETETPSDSTSSDSTKETETPSDSTKETEAPSTSKSSTNTEILDCLDVPFTSDDKKHIYSHICPNFTTNEILDNMEDVVNKIEENNTYKIIGKDFVAQVVPIDYLDKSNTNRNNEFFLILHIQILLNVKKL